MLASLTATPAAFAAARPSIKVRYTWKTAVSAKGTVRHLGNLRGARVRISRRSPHTPRRWRAVTKGRPLRSTTKFALKFRPSSTLTQFTLRVEVVRKGRTLAHSRARTFHARSALTPPVAQAPAPPAPWSPTPPTLEPTTTQTVVSDGGPINLHVGDISVNAAAGSIAPGQSLTLTQTAPAGFPATGVPSVGGGPFQVTTSQGEPTGPVTIALSYDPADFAAGEHPLLLHGDEDYRMWLPEPTSVAAADHLAYATVESFSPMDWANSAVYYAGLITGNRTDLPTDCGDAPDWVTGVALPVSRQQPLNVCFSLEGSSSAVLHLVNNRGYAQIVDISGIAYDLDSSSWGDSLDGIIADALAKAGTAFLGHTLILGPQQEAYLTITRPPDRLGPTDVTIDPRALGGDSAVASLAWAVLDTAQKKIADVPRSVVDCVIGAVTTANSGSAIGAIGTLRTCTEVSHALPKKQAELLQKIGYGLAVTDFFYLLQDRMADDVYPTLIGFTIPGTGVTDPAIHIGPYDLGTIPAGQRYTAQLDAAGGTAPYRFRLYIGTANGNDRPAWASISSAGLLTLDPPAGDESAHTFYVYAFDATGRHSPFARDSITVHTDGATGPPDTGVPVQYTSISADGSHACGATTTGHVRCWGSGGSGQLGNGHTADEHAPVDVTGIADAVQVSVGEYSSCALRAGGAVSCWGSDAEGQLGDGPGDSTSSVPVPVASLSDAVSVDAGFDHACALRATGGVVCWGDDATGQLGDDHTGIAATPVSVTGLNDATSVEAGVFSSCATRETSPPVCWGRNSSYQLGDGTQTESHVPVTVKGISDAQVVDGNGSDGGYGCAAGTGGLSCWGMEWDIFSRAYTTWDSETAMPVSGAGDAIDVAAGDRHACMLHATGLVACWGDNSLGALGDGTRDNSTTPVSVGGLDDVGAITAGYGFSCALRSDGQVACWGHNSSGQLGIGSTEDSLTPVTIFG